MSDLVYITAIIAMDIAWCIWVYVLRRIFDQSSLADAIATFIGCVIVLIGVQR
jgi:hypothetical protein